MAECTAGMAMGLECTAGMAMGLECTAGMAMGTDVARTGAGSRPVIFGVLSECGGRDVLNTSPRPASPHGSTP
jgi:hypothetical protein